MAKAVAMAEKKAAQLKKKKPGRGGHLQSWPTDAQLGDPRQFKSRHPSKPTQIVGPCFSFGEIGHLRRNCPKVPQSPRPYPLNTDVCICVR